MKYRWPLAAALVFACAVPAPGRALSADSPAGTGIPWWEQVVRAGIAVQVDIGGELRERGKVDLRFRLFDVATGQPLTGLAPAAWLTPIPDGEPFDATCAGAGALAFGPLRPLGELPHASGRGTYSAVTRLGRPGRYEVFFLLPAPRIVQCFQLDVRPDRGS